MGALSPRARRGGGRTGGCAPRGGAAPNLRPARPPPAAAPTSGRAPGSARPAQPPPSWGGSLSRGEPRPAGQSGEHRRVPHRRKGRPAAPGTESSHRGSGSRIPAGRCCRGLPRPRSAIRPAPDRDGRVILGELRPSHPFPRGLHHCAPAQPTPAPRGRWGGSTTKRLRGDTGCPPLSSVVALSLPNFWLIPLPSPPASPDPEGRVGKGGHRLGAAPAGAS